MDIVRSIVIVTRVALLVSVGLTVASAPPEGYAQGYPTRPVTIVVPFAPGSTTDVVARLLGDKLQERLGQPFMIEYKLGSGATIGAHAVAKTEPDGHTLLVGSSGSMAINATLRKNLPYDPVADFIPLALVARGTFILVVNASLPIHSVQDLVKFAKEKPGPLAFGSVGPGSPHHLFGELLKSVTGIQMTHVPYRGSVQPLHDVVAGQIQLMFCDFALAGEMILAGKVRPLGVTTKKRLTVLPDVPALAEAGFPEFDAASWISLATPSGTPKEIVGKLHAELQAILALPEIASWIVKAGLMPADNLSVAALEEFVSRKSPPGAGWSTRPALQDRNDGRATA
jgi:tripartite-type tricarboxylate transporter receptor subunit TctC